MNQPVREREYEVRAEWLTTFVTGVLLIPLAAVAWWLFGTGHLMFGAMVVTPAAGFIALAVVRQATVRPVSREDR